MADGKLLVLGLESSCDDTAAAVLRVSTETDTEILSSVVSGQTDLHKDFGGVVPEIAARAHAEMLDLCVEQALDQACVNLEDVDLIGVTSGPGLIGGVLSGVMSAKAIAMGAQKPLVGVNHLAGHALTPRMTDAIEYPYLMLVISGGHCQFLIVKGTNQFVRLGGTIDDAPGEAFDKTARLLGLPQPGGPSIDATARDGDPTKFTLPRPLLDREGCDMSFSGLKTAVLRVRDEIVRSIAFNAPPLKYCTDNAAMIAYAAAEIYMNDLVDPTHLVARPRWPLDQSKRPLIGHGKKGAKA
ncbi:MAG: tRNA (adenosine(37)-N6)-threonylcarbamoyltransferase complex transferase subunit TsaD [Rhodobacteraceae bacterium]|nr:tRNA (adenosine(37)-N6)-threonylcarbamoyltransferase complex transferase subunit TsaD [Paracoccaceae bacterium]